MHVGEMVVIDGLQPYDNPETNHFIERAPLKNGMRKEIDADTRRRKLYIGRSSARSNANLCLAGTLYYFGKMRQIAPFRSPAVLYFSGSVVSM
jgi:hypothetical protein